MREINCTVEDEIGTHVVAPNVANTNHDLDLIDDGF